MAPNATLALGQPRTLEFVIRTTGAPASVRWTAIPSGTAEGIFTPILGSTTGTLSLGADQSVAIPLTVTVPATAPNPSTGYIRFQVTYHPGGGKAAPEARSDIRAAAGGRPEFYPSPWISSSTAGAPASVVYQLRSTIGTPEQFDLTLSPPFNPDPNNAQNRFPYTLPTSPVTLPAAGTVQVSIPLYLPGNIFPGNLNAFSLSAQSTSDLTKLSDARGFMMASAPDVDSLPGTLVPSGLVKIDPVTPLPEVSGRDGPTPVPGRDLWLLPAGRFGVRVLRDSALNQVGNIDLDGNNLDDRLVGRIRPPTTSASIAVIPGFVNSAQEVLDVGLLAAGTGGLMLVDLRDIVDFLGVTWESWYDLDGDGIDDRILRRLPIPGFATDVEWFRTPEGRVVALVAAADTGSAPTSINYNPALTTPGTGAGIYAVDVLAALDSLPGIPFHAGTLTTAGDVLDLELRGGPQPELAVADGANGVTLYAVNATGSPATVSFTPLGNVPLDPTWGSPRARDVAWVPNAGDSLYLAVAAAAGGVQVISAPHGQPPFLALCQRVEAPAIGVATSLFGYVGVALGTSGATLLRLPSFPELSQISALASAPYHAPVVLDLGSSWTEGRPLRTGLSGIYSSSTTALRFRSFQGGATAPDLLSADGPRLMVLRTGLGGVTGVGPPSSSWTTGVRLRVSPNPVRDRAEFQVVGDWALAGAIAPGRGVEFSIVDLQGRVVRRLDVPAFGSGANPLLATATWDGRDAAGRRAAPGRYWVRAAQRGGWTARGAFLVLR